MSCEPAPGNYNILSYIDSNAVNTCPSLAPAEVVILNDVTPITLTAFNGPPDCTYLIQVHGGYVKSQAIPNTLQTIDDGNAVTWIFKYHPDKQAYSIQLHDNPAAGWTDPGGEPGCHRQLTFSYLQSPIPDSQLYRLVRVED